MTGHYPRSCLTGLFSARMSCKCTRLHADSKKSGHVRLILHKMSKENFILRQCIHILKCLVWLHYVSECDVVCDLSAWCCYCFAPEFLLGERTSVHLSTNICKLPTTLQTSASWCLELRNLLNLSYTVCQTIPAATRWLPVSRALNPKCKWHVCLVSRLPCW